MTREVAARRLRVGIDVREWVAGRRTGIGRYLEGLVERWTLPGSSVEPVLYANQSTVLPAELDGAPTRRLRERVTLWWDQVSLARALGHDGADVFLSPYYKAPLAAPCPTVITVHDLLFLDPEASPSRGAWLFRAAFLPAARLVAGRAARIITDSRRSRDDVIRFLRVPPDKVRVVAIGLRPGQLRVASAGEIGRVRAAYGLGEAYLLYVGNFKPHKNLSRLVRAFARLPESARGRHQLVLAGSLDAFTASLRDEARALGLDERVRFPGFVAEADLAALYGGATALVFPSLLEGFGVPVLEAMACGTPVVCSNVAPLAELAGDAALLVDPWREEAIAAGIAQALADEALRCRLAAAGRRRAALFTSAGSADAIRDVLAEAVEARGR